MTEGGARTEKLKLKYFGNNQRGVVAAKNIH